MKIKIYFALLTIMSIIFSCKTEKLKQDNTIDIVNKSSYVDGINGILKKYNENNSVVEIKNILFDKEGLNEFAIVTFDTKLKKNMSFAVKREFNDQGLVADEIFVYCEGSCTSDDECGLDISLGLPKTVTCSCDKCKMIYTHTNPNKINKINSNNGLSFAKESYKKTFNTENADDVSIKSVMFIENDKLSIQEITYQDKKGNKSAFIIANAKVKGITADGTALEVAKDFVVDCTGSCDCRERFFPATGAIECTCSPCKMTVTEIKPVE